VPLLPRFARELERQDDLVKVARIVLEAADEEQPATVVGATLPADRARMRGLPALARGVSGTAPGTDPLGALLHKEARGRRRRR
jgi:hypothetical protein